MSTITREQAQKIIEAADEVISALAGTNEDVHPESDNMLRLWDDLNDRYAPPEVVRDLARIALASLEAEPVAYVDPFAFNNFSVYRAGDTDNKRMGREWMWANPDAGLIPLYTAPPAPVSVPEAAPVAYIFKHPAGRLFWSLTDESNKGQRDVMPVYSAPVPAFVPPAIEPDYEVIKGILPTANPDEYACCIAADMWNACRAAMLQGAEPVTTAYKLREEIGSSLQLRNLIRQRHAEWSQATFGDVGPVGPLKHLSKEALEAAAEPEDLSEWADMQFLLWDAQRRAGISDGEITAAMEEKLKVNMARQWPEPKDGEPRLHIKAAPQQEAQ